MKIGTESGLGGRSILDTNVESSPEKLPTPQLKRSNQIEPNFSKPLLGT